MPAHDAPIDPDEAGKRRRDAGGALVGDDDGAVDRTMTNVRHGIDQIADKVKGLLRSDR